MSASVRAAWLLIWCIRAIVFIYDLITIPAYFFYQQPWKQWKRKNYIHGRRINPTDPSSPVVRMDTQSVVSFEGVTTMDEVFRTAVHKFPQKRSFGVREILYQRMGTMENGKPIKKMLFGDYKWLSYLEVDNKVEKVSKGLQNLGVESGHHVAIYAETRFEWFVTAQACFRLGAVVVTLYTTLGDEEVIHSINDSDVTNLVTSAALISKLKNMESRIPKVKTVVYMEDNAFEPIEWDRNNIRLVAFSQLEGLGAQINEDAKTTSPKPDDVALIMYTSGSTGIPKGVLMSHANLLCMVSAFGNIYRGKPEEEMYVAYLPLAHIFELSAECSFAYMGISIGYSSPFTLTDKSPSIIGEQDEESMDAKTKEQMMLRYQKCKCNGDLILLKPTILFVVPLLLDKIRKAITEGSKLKGPFAAMLFDFAIKYKQFWTTRGFQTSILNRLIFKKIRDQFGGRLRLMACGGAPLSVDTHSFVKLCFDANIIQGYGLTETSGASNTMSIDDPSTGSVGAPIAGCYIRLENWEEGGYRVTDQPNPRGELVIGGKFVTVGYHKNPGLTNESYRQDKEGTRWFYTGDIGELLPNGNFKLIDRKKELVKLSFGEYIALGKIEADLKTCPLVENICLYGNSYQMYIVALVVPDKKQLTDIAAKFRRGHLSHAEMCRDPLVIGEVTRLIQQYSRECRLKGAEIPKKVHLCSEDWTPENGLLTAGLKMRRRFVQDFYTKIIDGLYQN